MKRNIVAGNWKMNLCSKEGIALINNILVNFPLENNLEVVVAPSFINLYEIAKISSGHDNLFIASQDCSSQERGAFTGEVSAEMIASSGAKYVILGHSERRINFNETNKLLKSKVEQAFSKGLQVIFCCGESLCQRQSNLHFEWITSQISESLFHLSADQFSKIVLAYEPIWAIGTGITAHPDQAQEVHKFIRQIVEKKYGSIVSQELSILYGGSCNPKNARELFAQDDIDGGLIGGASLNAEDFIEIINSF